MKIIKELISGFDKTEYPLTDINKGSHNMKVSIIGQLKINKNKTKTGKDYYLVYITDDTGTISFPAWENTDFFKFLEENDSGQLAEIQGIIKINGKYLNIEAINLSIVEMEEDIQELEEKKGLPSLNDLKEEVNKRVSKITNPFLKEVVLSAFKILGDKVEVAPFTEKTAYNYRGGLLHQIIDMCDIVSAITNSINCSFWNESTILDEDILLAGSILSNLGKAITISVDDNGIVNKTFKGCLDEDSVYSRDITLKAIESTIYKLEEKAKEDETNTFNKEEYERISTELLHIVSSIKNNQSWGSLSTPRSKHAIILSHINNIVYTKGLFENFEKNSEDGNFFSKAYDNGKNYYIGNILR